MKLSFKKKKQLEIDFLDLIALARNNEEFSQRYINIIRKRAMKHNFKLPIKIKRQICKHCYSFLKFENAKVRTTNGRVIYTCSKCKKKMRFPLHSLE